MNIALGALIILLLLLPALFFRLGIFMVRGASNTAADNFSREQVRRNFITILSKFSFSETLFFFSIIPLIQHLISLPLLKLIGCQIDYEQLLNLFSSGVKVINVKTPFGGEIISFLTYNLIEVAVGFFLGWGATWLIMRNPGILRNLAGDSIWFKIFTGLLLPDAVKEKVSAILVDVLCETKEATIIYSGFLEKFDINENKQIDYITLTATTRRDLREGSQVVDTSDGATPPTNTKSSTILLNNGQIISVPGKFFTIPGNKILNINVAYLELVDKPDPNDPNKKVKAWQRLAES